MQPAIKAIIDSAVPEQGGFSTYFNGDKVFLSLQDLKDAAAGKATDEQKTRLRNAAGMVPPSYRFKSWADVSGRSVATLSPSEVRNLVDGQ